MRIQIYKKCVVGFMFAFCLIAHCKDKRDIDTSTEDAWNNFKSKIDNISKLPSNSVLDGVANTYFSKSKSSSIQQTETYEHCFVFLHGKEKNSIGMVEADFCKRELVTGQFTFTGNVRFWSKNMFLIGAMETTLTLVVNNDHEIIITKVNGPHKLLAVTLPQKRVIVK